MKVQDDLHYRKCGSEWHLGWHRMSPAGGKEVNKFNVICFLALLNCGLYISLEYKNNFVWGIHLSSFCRTWRRETTMRQTSRAGSWRIDTRVWRGPIERTATGNRSKESKSGPNSYSICDLFTCPTRSPSRAIQSGERRSTPIPKSQGIPRYDPGLPGTDNGWYDTPLGRPDRIMPADRIRGLG